MANESLEALPPLPKPGDFQAQGPGTAEALARVLAIIGAGAAGNAEQAALLFRTFENQDIMRAENARRDFEAQLALATEQRARANAATTRQQESERIELTRQGQQLSRDQFKSDEEWRAYQKQQDIEEKRRADRAAGLQQQALVGEDQAQYLNAVKSLNDELGALLATSKTGLSMSDVLGNDPTAALQSKEALTALIMQNSQAKLAAAYPDKDPKEVAAQIAAQIALHEPAIPASLKAQYGAAALAVQDSAIQKLKGGSRDMAPEEVGRMWKDVAVPQLKAAFLDDRTFTPDESAALVTLLEQKNVDKTLTLELLSAAVDQAVLLAATELGLDANDQEALADRAALALWEGLNSGKAMSSPLALTGESDPLVRRIQQERQALVTRASKLEAEGKAVEAAHARRKLPELDKQIEDAKASFATRTRVEQHIGRGARR